MWLTVVWLARPSYNEIIEAINRHKRDREEGYYLFMRAACANQTITYCAVISTQVEGESLG